MDVYDDLKGYVNLSGVRSTGLTLSVAMGKYVTEKLKEIGLNLILKDDFKKTRKGIPCFHKMTEEEQEAVIRENPLYGTIICRCETITEGEIVDAIRRPLGARTVDAVKRRVRAGMGRCQGGFCGPRVHEILARELGVDPQEILMDEQGTFILTSPIKEEAASETGI